jgi:hypothetical protein
MRIYWSLGLTVVLYNALGGCSDPPIPMTPGPYGPCGAVGVACFDSNQKAVACCDEGDLCGGQPFPNNSCPAGECCYEGTDAVNDSLGVRRKRHPQAPIR